VEVTKQLKSDEAPDAEAPSNRPDLTGAAAALAGYDYQVDVSVLAAIRLMLISKSATRVTLEPANQEDLEVDLEPDRPGRVEPRAALTTGRKLVIQVKWRTGEPWSIEDFKGLLNHGKKRKPARDHLKDPKTNYLLVTSAAAKGGALDLLVGGFEESADQHNFPASLVGTLPANAAGRVAVWGGLTPELVASKLRDAMTDLLHVPSVRQGKLLEALREEAKKRMRLGIPGEWRREDLVDTVRRHGGHLASSSKLDDFVPPSNFKRMKDQLENEGAIVIKGPSGTGKTQSALMLCELARKRNGALEFIVVKPTDAPASTRKLIDTGPTLFYIEDPWGQYSLLGGSEAWTQQLPGLLRENAGPDHQFVITSRTDVLTAADVGDSLKHWWVELDSENYQDGQLVRIYDRRSQLLPAKMQDMALAFRSQALDAFATPLQLDLYFSNLAKGPEGGEQDHAFLRRLLKLAHRDAVAGEVMRYLKALGGGGLAAVIWAMIASRGQFDRNQLVAVRRTLRRADAGLGDGLEVLVDRLVAASYLRQPAQSVAFAHPSVREGFENFIKKDWALSEWAIAELVSALTQLTGTYQDWGLETAAQVMQTAGMLSRQISDLDPPFCVSQSSQAAIDAWLDRGLIQAGSVFQPLLQLASDVGSAESNPSEVARWLLTGVKRGSELFLDSWKPPSFDDSWYVRIAADARTKQIADRFVREALPWERATYGSNFATQLDRLATGLTPAFIDAATSMVGGGFDGNVQAVANGAVRDLVAYEPVLSRALDDLAAVAQKASTEGVEQWRAIDDGELDAGVEEHYRTVHEDDGYASGVFVDAYVRARRLAGEWAGIRDHPRSGELVSAWARAVAPTPNPADEDEVRALIASARDRADEHYAWWALREHWRPSFAAELEERLLSDPREPQLRSELAYTALIKAPATLVVALTTVTEPATLVSLLVDMQAAAHRVGSKSRAARLRAVTSQLPKRLVEIIRALPTKRSQAQSVGSEGRSLLEAAATSACPDILSAIVPVIIASGGRPDDAIKRWLAKATDRELAVGAVEAAIAIGDTTILAEALRHDRADARRAALLALAHDLPDSLPPHILMLANDTGSKVRRLMVQILGERPSPDHQRVLLQLMGDLWSDADMHYDDDESYPIAREAVAALDAYPHLSNEAGEMLLDLADKTRDRLLSSYALILASEKCGPPIREKIWAMACRQDTRWLRVDALDALADASVLESTIAAQVTSTLIMTLPPILAVPATVLVSRHAPVEEAIRVLETIASSNAHRALLLIGAVELETRDRDSAARVLSFLGADHAAGTLLDAGQPLPVHALDDLGSARLRKHVRERLQNRIASSE
jgi:hypothetical protein